MVKIRKLHNQKDERQGPNCILLITDIVAEQKTISKIVGKWKFVLVMAHNKEKGLQIAESQKIDLIILSSELQKKETADYGAQIKKKSREAPMLVIVDHQNSNTMEFMDKTQGFLTRPINEHELMREMKILGLI